MKNKNKKKAGPKKEVKRPAHKKPRPKKYVEAKIPDLPPVPAEQITVTKEAPVPTVEAPKTKTITIQLELPDGQTEAEFKDSILSAVKQLKTVAELVEVAQAEEKEEQRKQQRYASCKLYAHPATGLIRRREFPQDPNLSPAENWLELRKKYAQYLNEEKPKTGWQAGHEFVVTSLDTHGSWQKISKPIIPEKKPSLFARVIGWFKRK